MESIALVPWEFAFFFFFQNGVAKFWTEFTEQISWHCNSLQRRPKFINWIIADRVLYQFFKCPFVFLCSFSALIKMLNERLKSIFTFFRGTNDKANELLFFLSSEFIAGNNKSMRIYMAFCQRNQGFESLYWKIYAYLFWCLKSCEKSFS